MSSGWESRPHRILYVETLTLSFDSNFDHNVDYNFDHNSDHVFLILLTILLNTYLTIKLWCIFDQTICEHICLTTYLTGRCRAGGSPARTGSSTPPAPPWPPGASSAPPSGSARPARPPRPPPRPPPPPRRSARERRDGRPADGDGGKARLSSGPGRAGPGRAGLVGGFSGRLMRPDLGGTSNDLEP
jgi:hypothetical protein